MSKQKAKATASKSKDAPAPQTATPTPAADVKPHVLAVVKKDAKFRGAREKWYARLVEHDGKPVDVFMQDTKDNPPALPKSGKPEAPGGWLSYFKRQGVVEVKPAG